MLPKETLKYYNVNRGRVGGVFLPGRRFFFQGIKRGCFVLHGDHATMLDDLFISELLVVIVSE